jgi:AcrR family transcriptional regulator
MSMASSAPEEITPRAREIVRAARELLEAEGPRALSMRRLAERLGIRAPSIYKHLPDKDALEAAIISEGLAEQADALGAAARNAHDPIGALARAYRDYAKRHPHLYRLMTDRPLRRDLLAPGVEERAAAAIIDAARGDRDLARAAWAFAHGMTILELDGRFPPSADLDAAWRRGVGALARPRVSRRRAVRP